MPARLRNYLRTNRRTFEFTQAEMAALLGISRHSVCSYELGKTAIPVKVLIACELIFDKPAPVLFPALYDAAQDDLMLRAKTVLARLADKTDAASAKKRQQLEGIPSRAIDFQAP